MRRCSHGWIFKDNEIMFFKCISCGELLAEPKRRVAQAKYRITGVSKGRMHRVERKALHVRYLSNSYGTPLNITCRNCNHNGTYVKRKPASW